MKSRTFRTRGEAGQALPLSLHRHPGARRAMRVRPHRRYPSLSDDHQPPLISVRVLALLMIIAILVALVLEA